MELDLTKKVLSVLLSSYKSSEAAGTVQDLSRVRSGVCHWIVFLYGELTQHN